jgi:hypothetical protein
MVGVFKLYQRFHIKHLHDTNKINKILKSNCMWFAHYNSQHCLSRVQSVICVAIMSFRIVSLADPFPGISCVVKIASCVNLVVCPITGRFLSPIHSLLFSCHLQFYHYMTPFILYFYLYQQSLLLRIIFVANPGNYCMFLTPGLNTD